MTKPNTLLLLILILISPSIFRGQKASPKAEVELQGIKLARRSAIDNFDIEVQRVQFAEIRGQIRVLMAAWLWDKAKDGEYALPLAIKTVEESIEKTESGYDCGGFLACQNALYLIGKYAPETKKQLILKYKLKDKKDGSSAYSDLLENNNGKPLADEFINAIGDSDPGLLLQAWPVIGELDYRNSPELVRILEAVISADGRGHPDYTASQFSEFSHAFQNRLFPTLCEIDSTRQSSAKDLRR
jgi:hypothetical protein